jgi:protein involved in polysaccharide export with SLBB domain
MMTRIGVRFSPLFVLAALALGACAGAEVAFPSELGDSLPQAIDVSLEDNSVEFTDIVQNIASDQWSVGVFTIAVTADTELEAGIAVGDTVKVHAYLADDGNFIAREISLANSDDQDLAQREDSQAGLEDEFSGEELEFVGNVETIGVDSWTIDGQTILVTPVTEINPEILVGDLVKVHAYLSAAGEVTAREIEPTNELELKQDDLDSKHDLKFVGLVEAIDGDTWVISGETFQLDPSTEIDAGITIGDAVEVYLFLTPDGLTIVREISLDDDQLIGATDGYGDDEMDDDELDDEDDDHSGFSESEHSDDDRSGGSDHGEDD